MRNIVRNAIAAAMLTSATAAIAQTAAPAPAPAEALKDTPKAAPAPAPSPSGIVTVGKERKRSIGRIDDIERGDNGCYFTLKDDKGIEFIEVGTFELCDQKPSPKGKRVELTYKMETIQAASCQGDKKCTKTEDVPLVIAMKVLE